VNVLAAILAPWLKPTSAAHGPSNHGKLASNPKSVRGIFSAPRAAWMFKVFGHRRVACHERAGRQHVRIQSWTAVY
jgi:hypothetical protein